MTTFSHGAMAKALAAHHADRGDIHRASLWSRVSRSPRLYAVPPEGMQERAGPPPISVEGNAGLTLATVVAPLELLEPIALPDATGLRLVVREGIGGSLDAAVATLGQLPTGSARIYMALSCLARR